MNKDLINSLIKVASSLDNMGFLKEANVVDRIAQELSSPVDKNYAGETQAYQPVNTAPVTTGQNAANDKYVKDINNYKNLLKQKKYKEAELFLQQVANSYQDQQQRNAFIGQARKINNQFFNQIDNEDNMSDDEIYNLLQKYGINKAENLADLNKKWNVMMTNLKNQNLLSENKRYLLMYTYRNIAAKFDYSAFGLEVSGNYKKDFEQLQRLYSNGLKNDTETFLSNVMSSDKYNYNQKQLFAKEAEIHKLTNNPEYYNDYGHLNTISYKSLNEGLNDYGVLKAKTYQEFNNAFYNMIKNKYMNKKFFNQNNDPKAPMIYGYPSVRKQLQLVKEIIMLQRGWKKPV